MDDCKDEETAKFCKKQKKKGKCKDAKISKKCMKTCDACPKLPTEYGELKFCANICTVPERSKFRWSQVLTKNYFISPRTTHEYLGI